MTIINNYINGQWQPAISAEWIDNIDPSTGLVYGQIPDSDERDVKVAIEAAEAAFQSYKTWTLEQRSDALIKISDGILHRFDELAAAESKDNGKPFKLAKAVDIPRAAANMKYFAQAITQFGNDSYDMGSQGINYTLHQPLGVVTCISPWNLPLYLFTWKIAPALAAGNCVIAKPSEVTPLTAHLLSEIINEVLPPGVFNIIHGYGHKVGEAMTTHPAIKAISFTGSTTTGRTIAQSTAPLFKKLSLEMGGKNPNIIFSDCDYDKMLSTTLKSSFANQGQICLCGSRIYVQRDLYDRFVKDFCEKASQLQVGPPDKADTQVGAIVSKAHMEKILYHIDLAKEEGGTILCGGQRVILPEPYNEGYYVAPTVITGLTNDCRTNQEEIFGPVVTIAPFDTEEDAIQLANGTDYGLSATLWTNDINKIHRITRSLQAGIVWVNTWLQRDLRTPFGGVKQSGVGREGGYHALRFFTEVKNVCLGS